jgi:hypothetical protein
MMATGKAQNIIPSSKDGYAELKTNANLRTSKK